MEWGGASISITNQYENTKEFIDYRVITQNWGNDNIKSETTQVDQNGNNQNLKIKIITTSYGFDFVTSNKEVLFSLHQTICDGVYIIDKLTGTAYRRGDKWVREYIKEDTIIIEPLID